MIRKYNIVADDSIKGFLKFPTYDEMAKEVAEKALDEYILEGKTLREWVRILVETHEERTDAFDESEKTHECDCISRGVYEQVAWERDVAIEQIHELGYELGQKIETSKDCISRAEVLKHSHIEYDDDGEGHRVVYVADIEELPSVTPIRPKGKWIDICDKKIPNVEYHHYECSNCLYHGDNNDYFCPSCGADMRGV